MYHKKTKVMKIRSLMSLFAILLCSNAMVLKAQEIVAQKDYIIALTPNWSGERFEDGRPKVSDDIINRVKSVSLEGAWAVLRNKGYKNQFSGDWKMIHSNRPMAGRALTAQYMPKRKAVREVLEKKGAEKGYIGDMVSWPIDLLQEGDLYIADSYGKINEGPIIGDNLGTAIYAKSKNGVVFNGSLRDLEGLESIDGFNAFVKGWHPSYQMEMMLTGINTLVRIGDVTVIPGDVVLAKRGGVIFIPAYLAEEVVIKGEFTALKDEFGHFCLREGHYTPGEIDGRWTAEIKNEFLIWLGENPSKIKMTRKQLDDFFKERSW
ncbi:MAG: 4-hydroxy-4-methyl-2-oxoglutarate aldolase [Cyclobacteriaceae bacterium]|jgi:regulator of RNase E activity RraA